MKSFKQFLEELPGDKNFLAHENFVSFRNSNGGSFNYSYAELNECLQIIYLSGDKLFQNLKRFAANKDDAWVYEETKYRLALVGGKYEMHEDGENKKLEFTEAIFPKNLNAVTTNLGSQTPNTVRILQLYAYYLTGLQPSADHKYPKILESSNLESFFSLRENLFKKYLEDKVAENSALKYIQAIKGTISRIIGKALFRGGDKEDLIKDLNSIVNNNDYIKLNEDGNGMYAAAVNHYKKFLENNSCDNSNLDIISSFRSLCSLTKEYNQSTDPWKTNDPRSQKASAELKIIQSWLKSLFGTFRGYEVDIKIGDGKGIFPKTPWVALFPPGQTVKTGANVGINFDRKGGGLACGFGGSPSAVPPLAFAAHDPSSPMEVATANHGYVNPREIPLSGFDLHALQDHIAESLKLCFDHLKLIGNDMFTNDDKSNLAGAVKATGFQNEDGLVDRLLDSLAAKPFLILTGNSGTGKTKLAELVSARLSGKDAHVTMAVGAGWTDNRNVVGFVNFLRTESTKGEGKESSHQLPLYQSTPILNLLLRAHKNPDEPHFLILDEMNLSHVERYFADFLSAMESTKGLIQLHSEGDEETLLAVVAGGEPVVPRRLAFPKNVFVIGTVNVDETTYMFSPKVLDRANVIEFRTGKTQIGQYLSDGGSVVSEITSGGESEQRGFLQLAKAVRSGTMEPLDAGATHSIGEALTAVFDIMADARLEFGFRTIKEILAYHAADHALSGNKADWKWEPIFDLQLLQKVLPKLHGSKRRLEALLLRLAGFCETGLMPTKDATYPDDLSPSGAVKYPRSRAKLVEMIEAVRRDQFVSFIH
jgi:5-methylcytosine-specific restriction protein B